MTQFKWELMDRKILGNGVLSQVWFKLTGTLGGKEAAIQGSIQLGEADPDNFVEWDDLTQDMVVSWLDANPHADDFKNQIVGILESPDMVVEETRPKFPWLDK